MKLVGRNFFDPSQASMLQHYRWVLGMFFGGFHADLGTSLSLERNTTLDTAPRAPEEHPRVGAVPGMGNFSLGSDNRPYSPAGSSAAAARGWEVGSLCRAALTLLLASSGERDLRAPLSGVIS